MSSEELGRGAGSVCYVFLTLRTNELTLERSRFATAFGQKRPRVDGQPLGRKRPRARGCEHYNTDSDTDHIINSERATWVGG